jgi:hypothetical protein
MREYHSPAFSLCVVCVCVFVCCARLCGCCAFGDLRASHHAVDLVMGDAEFIREDGDELELVEGPISIQISLPEKFKG